MICQPGTYSGRGAIAEGNSSELLGDLRMEIAGTDLQSFRDQLRNNEEAIKRIIDHWGKWISL